MKLINEKLNMWSCTLGELTYRQIKLLRSVLGEDSKLAEFESFFDDKTGQFILNEEYPKYDWVVKNYTAYLEADESERSKMWEKHFDDEFLCDLMAYLNLILRKKREYEVRKIINLQPVVYEAEAISAYNAIHKENMSLIDAAIQMYNCGLIAGKRKERAKKKKAL